MHMQPARDAYAVPRSPAAGPAAGPAGFLCVSIVAFQYLPFFSSLAFAVPLLRFAFAPFLTALPCISFVSSSRLGRLPVSYGCISCRLFFFFFVSVALSLLGPTSVFQTRRPATLTTRAKLPSPCPAARAYLDPISPETTVPHSPLRANKATFTSLRY